MQNLEKAIRQTFLKINAQDPQMRQRVYQSVWQIYEKALKKHTEDPAVFAHQKQNFEQLKGQIEAEFTSPNTEESLQQNSIFSSHKHSNNDVLQNPLKRDDFIEEKSFETSSMHTFKSQKEKNVENDGGLFDQFSPARERENLSKNSSSFGVRSDIDKAFYAEKSDKAGLEKVTEPFAPAPDFQWEKSSKMSIKDKYESPDPVIDQKIERLKSDANVLSNQVRNRREKPFKTRKKRRLFWPIIFATWIIVGGGSIFCLYRETFGLELRSLVKMVSHSPETVENEQNQILSGEKTDAVSKVWTPIFLPKEVGSLKFSGDIIAKVENDKDIPYLRLIAKKGSDTIRVPLKQDVLEEFAGKAVTFAIVLRTETSMVTQKTKLPYKIQVSCDFGNGKTCGVFHYEVPLDHGSLLLPTVMPEKVSGQSVLIIKGNNPQQNYMIDIYSISISTT